MELDFTSLLALTQIAGIFVGFGALIGSMIERAGNANVAGLL